MVEGVRSQEQQGMENRSVEAHTLFIGLIDVLQFWTPLKRIARFVKSSFGMEIDANGDYHGEILDTLQPRPYRDRFMQFTRELFTSGSWLQSFAVASTPSSKIQYLPIDVLV